MEKRKKIKQSQAKLEIVLGLFVLGIGMLALGYVINTPPEESNPNSPLAQYERALKKQAPVFLFAHSTDCESCLIMMEIVDEVYPSFAEKIELIDVIVSEPDSRLLMEKLNIRAIPGMIFVDSAGETRIVVGPMEAEHLQDMLLNLTQNP